MKYDGNLPTLLESFFTQRLMSQRQVSPNTVASYRDAFRILLPYAQERLKKRPSSLSLTDLDVPFITGFLDHLEKNRKNGVRTRNLRLSTIHSFFRYVAFQEPASADLIGRVLAIPAKRYARRQIGYLSLAEIDALLAIPDRKTWSGRRDYALLLLAIVTGLRVSELIGLRRGDIVLGVGAHVRCHGKGRKDRATPLGKDASPVIKDWLGLQEGKLTDPLFPNARGGSLSRDGVEYLLKKHVAVARRKCPTLAAKRVTPHVLRHSCAMRLLLAGVDRSVIALWLGHEYVETTQMYVDANIAMKEKALERTTPQSTPHGRFQADDKLLAFLKNL